jgi:hypothetical protein
MGQIRLTNQERIQALQRLGYGVKEAAFLCLAALHGGYFLRRQYGQFLSRLPGGSAAALIAKVLDNGHARGTTYATNTHIYHLGTRPFYAALGQEDNRNRRLRQPATIKNKLMGLDFVLALPDRRYLATEQEKVDYFTGDLRLDPLLLPAKRYANSGGVGACDGESCQRYFVEKFPMFLSPSPQAATPPVVGFVYVDEGQAGLSGFWTFLQNYASLWANVRQFQVIYVAANDIHFEAAAGAFGRFLGQTLHVETVPSDPLIGRMLEHFEARRLHENRDWASFDRAKLIRFRDGGRQFSGEKFEALYRQWKAGGAAAVKAILSPQTALAAPAQGTFLSYRLEHNYDLFGNGTTY